MSRSPGTRGRRARLWPLVPSRISFSPRVPRPSPLLVSPILDVPRPFSLRDFFAFEEHVKSDFAKRGEPMPPEWYEIPVYYKGNHQSIIGPDDEVRWPSFTEKFDYGLEFACVIGRTGKDISAADARCDLPGDSSACFGGCFSAAFYSRALPHFANFASWISSLW